MQQKEHIALSLAKTGQDVDVVWNAIPGGMVSQGIGSTWLKSGASALYVVPSAFVEEESNVLINLARADAAKLVATKVRQFFYDAHV